MPLAKFRCAPGRVVVTILYVCFRSTLVVFIFCLMNFNDDKSDCSMLEYRWRIFEFEVRERDFSINLYYWVVILALENERLTVFVCYHRAVRKL